MNLKILSIIGVMALTVALWFFYKEEVSVKPATPATPEVSYEVQDIKAVQTNATTGEVEYTLIAQSLTKNEQGEDVMLDTDMQWRPTDGSPIHLSASRAKHSQTTGEIVFDEGFILTKQPKDSEKTTGAENADSTHDTTATPDETTQAEVLPELVIKGTSLIGNTKANTIKSDEPIHITQGENSFMAQRLDGNVQTGDYEFHQVQIEFNPPKRTDKPLF